MKNTPALFKSANMIGQRLKYEMKSRGINSAELAKRADVKTSFIYDVISGKSSNPSTVKLARVAEALGVTLANLVDTSPPKSPAVNLSANDYIVIPALVIHELDNKERILGSHPDNQPFCFLHSWINRHLRVAPADLRVFTISGDSMESTLCHNDIVLVDITKKNPTQPGIFVLFDGYGLVVKRVERIGHSALSRLRILSDNPQYSIYESSPEDAGIIGRVIWFSRGI